MKKALLVLVAVSCDAPPSPPNEPPAREVVVVRDVCAITASEGWIYWSMNCNPIDPTAQIFRRRVEGGSWQLLASGIRSAYPLKVDDVARTLSFFEPGDLGSSGRVLEVSLDARTVQPALHETATGAPVYPVWLVGPHTALQGSRTGRGPVSFIEWPHGLTAPAVLIDSGLTGRPCAYPGPGKGFSRARAAVDTGDACRTLVTQFIYEFFAPLADQYQTTWPIVGLFDGLDPVVRDGDGGLWLQAETGYRVPLPGRDRGIGIADDDTVLWFSADRLYRVAVDGAVLETLDVPTPDAAVLARAVGASQFVIMLRQGELSVMPWPPE